ncbi:MAG: DUF721 domain-containing protein [Myxococcales bacterium]|nr:DUF721 domain-containing protein [Myxococcales bacterium]MCB9577168.1 DUF721 domain-containing protein [Polyangiaceae bacterium]
MAKPPTTPDGKRRRKPRSAPRGEGPALVGALLSDAEAASAERAGIGVRPDTWRSVVGERIARSATPGRIYKKTLTVRVASAVWAQELSFLADDLLARLRKAGVDVSELRFRVAPREPTAKEPPRPKPGPRVPLPQELEARLAQIDDPDLRNMIAEAAQSSLAVKRGATSKRPAARGPRSAAPRSDPRGSAPATRSADRRRKP